VDIREIHFSRNIGVKPYRRPVAFWTHAFWIASNLKSIENERGHGGLFSSHLVYPISSDIPILKIKDIHSRFDLNYRSYFYLVIYIISEQRNKIRTFFFLRDFARFGLLVLFLFCFRMFFCLTSLYREFSTLINRYELNCFYSWLREHIIVYLKAFATPNETIRTVLILHTMWFMLRFSRYECKQNAQYISLSSCCSLSVRS